MKSTYFLKPTTLLLAAAIFFSCSDDDEKAAPEPEEPKSEGSFTHKGTSFDITGAVHFDAGLKKYYGWLETETHHDYYIMLSDGQYDYIENPDKPGTFIIDYKDRSYEVYLYLRSPATDPSSEGTFMVDDLTTTDEEEVIGKHMLYYAELWFDTNGNGIFEDDLDDVSWAEEGSAVVEGSGDWLTVTYDLKLNTGETLKGTYTGEFQVFKKK